MFSGDVLKGKRILVTGGGTGLGKEMSVGFAAHGAHVFICGRRQEVLDNAVGEIHKRSGGQADALVANVRDPDSIEKMMADIWTTGPLTGLVNNAGANFLAPTETLSPRGYEAVRSTVMDGSFYAAQACGKRWIAAGLPGVIISNLVTWVWTGSAYVVPAAMAKAAVHAMTMSLAVEWGPKGIRVNAIAPGPTQTGYITPEMEEALLPSIPLRRLGTPADIADVVLMFASEEARWMTGQVVQVAGGHAL